MLVLLHESGTEGWTNDTIYFFRIAVAKGRHGSIQVAETHISYNCGLLLQIYRDSKADRTTAEAVTHCCKNIFSRHNIPDEVIVLLVASSVAAEVWF